MRLGTVGWSHSRVPGRENVKGRKEGTDNTVDREVTYVTTSTKKSDLYIRTNHLIQPQKKTLVLTLKFFDTKTLKELCLLKF